MSGNKIQRRDFLRKASALSMAAAAFSFEAQAPSGCRQREQWPAPAPPEITANPLPAGRLGNLKVSRLIGGHNLVCFPAIAGDGRDAPQLPPAHSPDEKILATFALYEKVGINTAFLQITGPMVATAGRYVTEREGKLQWIAQLVIDAQGRSRDLDLAMKLGVHAACIRGIEGDRYAERQIDVLAKAMEELKACKIPVGLGGYNIDTMIAAEKARLPVDFYVKTFNNANTSMSGENAPGETAEIFAEIEKPWIAFRVLGPGRMSARDGFKRAFGDGADFVSAGMFDFQLAEDARLVRELLAGKLARARPWRA